MKKLTTIFASMMLGISMTACSMVVDGVKTIRVKASENYVTKEIRVSDFDKINLIGSGNVYFTQQPGAPAVSVVTSDNVAEILDVYVENNTLCLRIKKGYSVNYLKKLDYTVNAAALKAMNITGSGDFKLMNGLTTDNLKLSITGSGDMDCNNVNCSGNMEVSISGSGDINADNLQSNDLSVSIAGSGDIGLDNISANNVKANISGSGDIKLKGKTLKAKYSIAGSGDIAASDLLAEDVIANTSGSGDITCYASTAIEASRAGSGSIGYKGNPQKVNISKKGVYAIE